MKETLTQKLSRGVNQLSESRVKRDARICPRCRKHAVSRDQRRCLDCKGNLLFPGDTAARLTGDWFLWHRSTFGVEGWFHRSFWEGGEPHVASGLINLH